MNTKDDVLRKIREVFGSNEYPGDAFLSPRSASNANRRRSGWLLAGKGHERA